MSVILLLLVSSLSLSVSADDTFNCVWRGPFKGEIVSDGIPITSKSSKLVDAKSFCEEYPVDCKGVSASWYIEPQNYTAISGTFRIDESSYGLTYLMECEKVVFSDDDEVTRNDGSYHSNNIIVYCILSVVLTLKMSFWAASYYFLRNPLPSSHAKVVTSAQMFSAKVIAHRGSKSEGIPENTIPAFQHACNIVGVDIIELDVWLTKDNYVVVFHDGTFERMCNGMDGHINDTLYKDLPKVFYDKQELETAALGKPEFSDGVDMPLFCDVLDAIADTQGLIVEIKQDSQLLYDKVHQLLTDHNRVKNGSTVWFSLKAKINKKLRLKDNTIPTICSVEEMVRKKKL